MTVHPENIVSGGGDSSEAASSHPVQSRNRCGKSRVLAILFGRPVRIDSSSRAVSMPGSQASPVDDSRPRGGVSGARRRTAHGDRPPCVQCPEAVLKKHGLLISMSGKGNCYDNAVVETFFKTIKSELIWPVAWQTRSQAENAVARYIDGFYNPIRRHSTLGYQSPVQFEMAGRE